MKTGCLVAGSLVILSLLVGSLGAQRSPQDSKKKEISEILRRADAAFDDENRALAERLYRQALDLDPFQSRALYRIGQLSRDDSRALGWFRRYVEQEPGDAWGWLAAGDKYLKTGKSVEALKCYQRAAGLAPDAEDVRERLAKGRLRAAPDVEPLGGYAGDSDQDATWRGGLRASAAMPGGFRLGGTIARSEIGDGRTAATLDQALIRLEGRPQASLRLNLSLGVARLGATGKPAEATAEGDLRIRWRQAPNGPALEVRGLRLALGTTPLLIANRAMRNEMRAGIEWPAGPLRVRISGRVAAIETTVEASNRRRQGDAALVVPWGASGEISFQYHRLGFDRPSAAGYFAPRLVETIEGGTYWDLGGDGPWSVSFDLGLGLQKLARANEDTGPWKTALRGWGSLSFDINPRIQFRAEAEGYSAPFAPAGVTIAEEWRYASVALGLLFKLSR